MMLERNEKQVVTSKLLKTGIEEQLVNQLLTAYEEPWRKYHGIEHIESMLKYVEDSEDELTIAIALHDIVYANKIVSLGVNEYRSAQAVPDFCTKQKPDSIRNIQDAITATAFYYITQSKIALSEMSQRICDYDLCNLAFPYGEMQHWCNLAMEEADILLKNTDRRSFLPTDYNDRTIDVLLRGQLHFLQSMLHRSQIYYVMTDWEDQARQNIKRRIHTLRDMAAQLMLYVQGNGQEIPLVSMQTNE